MVVMIAIPLAMGQSKETRKLDGFTSVSFGVSGKLFLKQGNSYEVVLEGDADLLDQIETEVRGGELVIRKENWRIKMNEKVTVYITMPSIDGLGVSGSGTIVATDALKCDDLDIRISGSGTMELAELSADRIDAGISGSGNILVSGSGADQMELSISGSGDFRGEDFEVKEMEISVSGSGSCRCNVTGSLEARVSGSGDIYYTGNPQRTDARTSGSGKVRKL